MRRSKRRLSRRDCLLVEETIRQFCALRGVSARDEDYRSVAWTAFLTAFRRFRPISSPDFWPYAYSQMEAAILAEKRFRQERLYRLLSLDVPVVPGCRETILDHLPARRGDFTNGVLFWDFLVRLPRNLYRLAVRLIHGDDLEEARSMLRLTEREFRQDMDGLRTALLSYLAI